MQWLEPTAVWGLISLAAITVLYLLRRRSRSVTVPSLLLWQRAAVAQQAMRPLQRLKKSLLYFLQMALAALLVIALMRPAVSGGVQGETVLIFDLSASMQAREDGVSRLQMAQRKANALIDGMREGDRVTVLAAGSTVETRVSRSADLTRVRATVDALQAGNGGADLAAAVSLALAMQQDIEGLNIIVFSDTYEGLPPVQTVRTGGGAENRALLSLSVSADGQAFARVANYGEAAQITVACYADGALCDAVPVVLEAGEVCSVLMQTQAGAQSVRAEIWEEDALAADNERWYVARTESNWRVALCAENVFLEKALLLRDDLTLLRAAQEEAAALEQIDLYVFDGALPQTLPEDGALLCLAPDRAVLDIAPEEAASAAGTLRAAYSELGRTLSENLTLEGIALRTYTPLRGGSTVLTWGGRPLVAVTEQNGRRAAVVGFDLHDSNLPVKGDFPILMQNLLGWLLPDVRQTLTDGECGEALPLPADSRAARISVITPFGRTVQAAGVLNDTEEQGVYTLRYEETDGSERLLRFALHMAAAESDVRRTGSADGTGVTLQTQAAAGRELTVWVLLAFLALLLVEWGVSRRAA